jgi:hypothetical protein
MATASLPTRPPSLAEYLAGLTEGQCCPCCGATLRSRMSSRSSVLLACEACGCEVEGEEWPFRALSAGKLGVAA